MMPNGCIYNKDVNTGWVWCSRVFRNVILQKMEKRNQIHNETWKKGVYFQYIGLHTHTMRKQFNVNTCVSFEMRSEKKTAF